MYDIIIIGGGAAGMSAAIYAMRGGMKTLILEKLACGGQAARTYEIDNYPGFADNPTGPKLMEAFEDWGTYGGAILLAVMNPFFLCYDVSLSNLAVLYRKWLKPRILGRKKK